MTAVARILETFAQQGVSCRRDGDRLMLKPATGTVPADLIQLARAHKPELLAVLPTVPQTAAERVEAVLHRYGLPLDLLGSILAHGGAEAASRLQGLALARFVNIRATRELHDRGVLRGTWAIPSVAHLQTAEPKT
ncbi:MAG: hypothetical protein M0Z99_28505 [Betaproteobacteria bacterium]|nr:hypothetical protein [Betaproteobacteria bacterium]